MAVLYFPVILLAIMIKFYWYHRRPGPCAASEVENVLTPWLPHISSPCWAKVVSIDSDLIGLTGSSTIQVGH